MLKVALIQLASTSSKTANLAHARSKVLEAASAGAQLIVLPECFQSPYAIHSFESYAESLSGPSCQMLSDVAKEARIYLVGGSIPERLEDRIYNTCCVYDPDGQRIAIHRKVHLFDIHVPDKIQFEESAVLSPGNALTHFEMPWGKIGLGICYDLRFPEMALLAARKEGVLAMIYPGKAYCNHDWNRCI